VAGVEVSVGGFRWWLAPNLKHILLGPTGLKLAEWLQAGQARVVKKGPHRIVYRVDLPELHFYVKRNLVADRSSWVRQLIRPSKAQMEYQRAGHVAERGLPTYTPLAFGEQNSFFGVGESILITRSLEETHELHLFAYNCLAHMPARRQARLRQRLAIELGKLVARMHDAGIRHDDLHPANILVRLDENDELTLFLIDLTAVRLGAPLSWRQSRHNIVILNRWFVLRASRSDRFRFWTAYCRERRDSKTCAWLASRQGPDSADEIEKQTLVSNLRFWRRRDKRSLDNNRYYRRVRAASIVGHAVVDLDPELLASLQADPDEPFRRAGVKFLKDSQGSTVIELEGKVEGRPKALIYKRFNVTSSIDPWTALVRPSPAMRSWVRGQGFRERGLPTARPLAVLERRKHGLCREGYLLMEKIDNAQGLHEFLAELPRLAQPRRLAILRRQIDQVATVLRELHRRCLSHRDLKAANILVSRDDHSFYSPFSDRAWATGSPGLLPLFATSVWLIDLVGVRLYGRLPRGRKVQNLARLNASFPVGGSLTRTDRLRFLRTYLHWSLYGKTDWKAWWRAINQATRAKVERNEKRGRPLA
jgi:serine/threonine protein kinase